MLRLGTGWCRNPAANTEERQGQGPLNAASPPSLQRDRVPSEGAGQAQRPPPSAAHPLVTHIYTLESRDPLRLQKSPQPQASAASDSPGMETHPVQAGPSGRPQSPLGGGRGAAPGASRSARTRGPCVTTQRAPQVHLLLQASDISHGNRRKTSEAANRGLVWKRPQRPLRGAEGRNMPTSPKAHFQLPGREAEEKVITSPPGAVLFL